MLIATPGAADANSYATALEAQAHWDATGFDHSGFAVPAIEAALIRATAWMDGTYRARFSGQRENGRAQSLEWPRSNATDRNGEEIESGAIPREVVSATAEAAQRELAGVALSPDVTPGQAVKRTREKIGPIEEETEFAASCASPLPTITTVDHILEPILVAANQMVLRA